MTDPKPKKPAKAKAKTPAKKPAQKPPANASKRQRGRPNATTPEQDEEIRRRLLSGEAPAHIAREMQVSERHIGRIKREGQKSAGGAPRLPTDAIKDAAQKSVENALNDPAIKSVLEQAGMEDRNLFFSLTADITETALIISMAGKISATSSKRLAAMALSQLDTIKDPEKFTPEDAQAIKNYMVLQSGSNMAANIPMSLMGLAARRGGNGGEGEQRTIKLINEPDI